MSARKTLAFMLSLGLLTASCAGTVDPAAPGDGGGGGGGSQPTVAPTDLAGGGGSGGGGDGAGGSLALPPEFAEFPLPQDSQIIGVQQPGDIEDDPRQTLVVTVIAKGSIADVIQFIDGGLEPAGYVVGDDVADRVLFDDRASWQFTKDGIPGTVSVGINGLGDPLVTLNLHLALGT